jgi:hypothetical protein
MPTQNASLVRMQGISPTVCQTISEGCQYVQDITGGHIYIAPEMERPLIYPGEVVELHYI